MKTESKHTTVDASIIDLVPPEKPKGALSAYNIFLLVTRRRVLNGNGLNDNTLTLHITSEIEPQEIEAVLQERNSQKGKRAHRKTHGKISFRALSRLIAAHWKTAHPASLRLLKIHEKRETANFKSKMKEYELASEAYQAASQEVKSDTRLPSNSLLSDLYNNDIAINNALCAVELSALQESTMNSLFKILTGAGTSSSDLMEPLDGQTMNALFAQ
eukprot:CAMPEP_0198136802 /NCGR_PEP_ID=MMETSP1443-20131203/398_1 /TAXON_ID=186043 /ORGANISM="Entomoneis sp., Strain CCMP2396" /LENGTH=215 /DNA_ID=CAMNT_0043798079 /DNA_START=91 /DNA_END=738 /DNA_ORIENTATION=+